MSDKTGTTREMTNEELLAELAKYKTENEALKQKKAAGAKLRFKVGEKGGLSVYHGSRFPVTLYGSQWAHLLKPENVTSILAALEEFKGQLKTKPESE